MTELPQKSDPMLSPRSLRTWSVIHRWTSIICTAFMLLLCLTGLPLVFGHELDILLGDAIEAPQLSASQANARAKLRRHPRFRAANNIPATSRNT